MQAEAGLPLKILVLLEKKASTIVILDVLRQLDQDKHDPDGEVQDDAADHVKHDDGLPEEIERQGAGNTQ